MQLYGVAMGSRVSPTFACLFVGWLAGEDPPGTVENKGKIMPYLPKWFIDDFFSCGEGQWWS